MSFSSEQKFVLLSISVREFEDQWLFSESFVIWQAVQWPHNEEEEEMICLSHYDFFEYEIFCSSQEQDSSEKKKTFFAEPLLLIRIDVLFDVRIVNQKERCSIWCVTTVDEYISYQREESIRSPCSSEMLVDR